MSDNCSFGRLHHCIELRDLGFIFAEHLHRQAVESMECADITPQTPLFEIFIIGRVEDKPSQWLPLNTGFVTPKANDRTQFPVKCRRSKWKPRKAITQLVAKYVAATTTSFFTNESSSFEQISTRRPKISPARPMATSTMK